MNKTFFVSVFLCAALLTPLEICAEEDKGVDEQVEQVVEVFKDYYKSLNEAIEEMNKYQKTGLFQSPRNHSAAVRSIDRWPPDEHRDPEDRCPMPAPQPA